MTASFAECLSPLYVDGRGPGGVYESSMIDLELGSSHNQQNIRQKQL